MPIIPIRMLFVWEMFFSYMHGGQKFRSLGESFTARQGKWIGAKIGTYFF